MRSRAVKLTVIAALGASALVASAQASAQPPADTGRADDVAAFWTPEKIASAQPRDLVIDSRGLGYQRAKNGSLTPYGHSKPIRLEATTQARQVPNAKPSGGSNDSTPPSIGDRSPATGATINVTTADPIDFSAVLTDASGIASASIVIHLANGSTQSFAAAPLGNNLWGTAIQGFTAGTWEWHVIARDGAGRGGNTATSDVYTFTVTADGGSGGDPGGGGGSGTVTNSRWALGGDIQGAAGRILFEMPTEVRRGRNITVEWNAYVCSGTAVTDSHDGASIILTAAHCVYDDVSKAFARNVLFIPNQDDGGTDRTDSDCTNDPFGCWSPTNGVVNLQWTNKTFPANVEWDYGYYVVPHEGAHTANGPDDTTSASLESAVEELTIGFGTATAGTTTHALGYSYSDDPNFMYCAEPMGVKTANVNWWLPGCDLSGGSSGGPWVQPMNEGAGNGPIISVNSWGYTAGPGMAGPFLGATASCTFGAANRAAAGQPPTPGVIPGVIVTC